MWYAEKASDAVGIPRVALLLIVGVLLAGCADDKPTTPTPATGPTNPSPGHRTVDVDCHTELTWTPHGVTGDTVRYDVYLGTTNPPGRAASGLTDSSFHPGGVDFSATYYWQVVEYNNAGDTARSGVWQFNTASTFTFPMTTGNTWDYAREFGSFNYNPDSLGTIREFTVYDSSQVTISGTDTIPVVGECQVFRWVWSGSDTTWECRRQTTDGLYTHAYAGLYDVGPPKARPRGNGRILFAGIRFSSVEEMISTFLPEGLLRPGPPPGSWILEDPPIRVLAYPLEIGQRWIYRDTAVGHVWNMEKEVTAVQNITAPTGSHKVFKVQWRWDVDGDGLWDSDKIDGYDYIAPAGVIRREFMFYNSILTNEWGDSLGTFDTADEWELAGYHVE